jgi:hypothetical protein
MLSGGMHPLHVDARGEVMDAEKVSGVYIESLLRCLASSVPKKKGNSSSVLAALNDFIFTFQIVPIP